GDVRRKIVAARLAAQNTGLDTAVAEFRRIVAETATYLYFSSTVQEFFERFSQASRTDAAAVAKVARDADDIAACRRAFTAGPRLAWTSISRFRTQRHLDSWALPPDGRPTGPSPPG